MRAGMQSCAAARGRRRLVARELLRLAKGRPRERRCAPARHRRGRHVGHRARPARLRPRRLGLRPLARGGRGAHGGGHRRPPGPRSGAPARRHGADRLDARSTSPSPSSSQPGARDSACATARSVLADIVASGDGICVAGAHGKTSTTALIAYVLAECGEDPTFLVGGDVPQLGVNARVGSGTLRGGRGRRVGRLARPPARRGAVVPERRARPSRSLRLARRPARALPRLGRRAPARGRAGAARLARLRLRGRAAPVRRRAGGGLAGARRRPRGDGIRFVLAAPGPGRACRVRLGMPGAHNALNATAALACSTGPGISPERAAAPLAAFRGAARRYERKGEVAGIRLVDDYAHHPSELAATLAAARGEAASGAPAGLLSAAHAVAHADVRRRLRERAPPRGRRLRLRRLRGARRRRPGRHGRADRAERAARKTRRSRSPGRRRTPMRPTGSRARRAPAISC